MVVHGEQIFEMELLHAGKRLCTLLYTPTLSHLTLNFSVQWKYLATKLSIMITDVLIRLEAL